MKLNNPGDVSKEVRELAGMLFPATATEWWADRAVGILEAAAKEIDGLDTAESTERQRPTKANPDAPGNGA